MLNVKNTGFRQCKTVKLATMDSITQIVIFTHQMSPPDTHSRSQRLSVNLSLVPLHAADNVYGQTKSAVRCVSCGSRKQNR